MKTLLFALLTPVLLKTCDAVPDQIGTPPPPRQTTTSGNNNTPTGGGGTTPTPTDTNAPIDGGLGVLLVAGTAYGVRRYRNYKQTKSKPVTEGANS